MTYRELVKKMQHYSGMSDDESETALRLFIKKLAARLTPEERMDLASQLPVDLQDEALTNERSRVHTAREFIQQFCNEENIDEGHAKKQIMSAWQALKDAISEGEIKDIRAQLPRDLAAQLY